MDLLNFLFVQNLTSVTTILAGSVAYIVYRNQKTDTKVNGARVILSEIRNAEQVLEQLESSLENYSDDLPSVLPVNSWQKYSYLFASDFDQDELEEINKFYGYCQILQEAVSKHNNNFWVTAEHRIKVVQEKLADLILASSVAENDYQLDSDTLEKLKRNVLENFSNDLYRYAPNKTSIQIQQNVKRVPKITTTTTGSKLKRIARQNSRVKIFRFF